MRLPSVFLTIVFVVVGVWRIFASDFNPVMICATIGGTILLLCWLGILYHGHVIKKPFVLAAVLAAIVAIVSYFLPGPFWSNAHEWLFCSTLALLACVLLILLVGDNGFTAFLWWVGSLLALVVPFYYFALSGTKSYVFEDVAGWYGLLFGIAVVALLIPLIPQHHGHH